MWISREFEAFVAHLLSKAPNILSIRKVATLAHHWGELFPLTNKLYELLVAAPVTVVDWNSLRYNYCYALLLYLLLLRCTCSVKTKIWEIQNKFFAKEER